MESDRDMSRNDVDSKQEALWCVLGRFDWKERIGDRPVWIDAPIEGVTLDDVRRLGLVELAELVVARPKLRNVVALELLRSNRKPARAAGSVLVHAYREGRATGELTAFFLAGMRADDGYEVASEILQKARRTGAEGAQSGCNAVSAMVIHAPAAASAILLELLCDETAHPRLRRHVAFALNEMVEPSIVPAIFEAVRTGRLGPVRGAAAIQRHPVGPERLIEWLATDGGDAPSLAFELIRRHAYRDVDEAVARAVHVALESGRLRLGHAERQHFEIGIAQHQFERPFGAQIDH